jgi:hypothetical protein
VKEVNNKKFEECTLEFTNIFKAYVELKDYFKDDNVK